MPSIGEYLQPVLNTGIQMKDYAHASRLYADSVFALAPKTGFLYYVEFDIDPSTLTDTQWANQQRFAEVGLLVKSVDLPKFSVQTETVNQYNRRTVIQKGITYNPLNLTFHDDNSNVVHNMWLNYYRYYYADSTWGGTGPIGTAKDNTPGAYQNNKYLPSNDLFNPTNYGMNSKLVVAPFFRSITIYQLSRKIFTSYKLVNPIIQTWEHDKLDQSSGSKIAESKMTVNYEAVFYGTGQVRKDSPTGFATFHYDNSPSPLSLAGGGNNSIFGPGGVVPGALDIYGDVSNILNPDTRPSPLGLLGTIIKGENLVRNVKGVTIESLRAEGYKILNNTLRNVARGSANVRGLNLNLNKSDYATSGQFLGTPVAVVTAAAIGQEFGQGGTTTQTPKSNGITPTSASSANQSDNVKNKLASDQSAIASSNISGSGDDATPSGNVKAPGSYFSEVQGLLDTTPVERSDIGEFSAVEDVDNALSDITASWAQDNEYISGQSLNADEVSQKLNDAASYEEYAAIKTDADNVFASARTAQSAVDAKYRAEFERLTFLKQSLSSNTSGPTTLGVDEDGGDTPAIESSSTLV
jgi:hypothetical protein